MHTFDPCGIMGVQPCHGLRWPRDPRRDMARSSPKVGDLSKRVGPLVQLEIFAKSEGLKVNIHKRLSNYLPFDMK